MGKKVSPISLRIGITRTWDSQWYADAKSYKGQFLDDLAIRKFLEKKAEKAGVARIEIHRHNDKIELILHAAKPGMLIGRSGDEIRKIEAELSKKFGGRFLLTAKEVRKPDTNAELIAQNIADQVTKRFPYRRVCKMSVDRAKEAGVKGIKILISGRLNGVDIARKEVYNFGTVPLHTLRANIDYATSTAPTTYGQVGIKVWTYHGLVFKNKALNQL